MLLVLFTYLVVTCSASPYHKYPFVFLLDIGNEELGKGNEQQLKLSVPGGSLAIKYPATNQGDVIGHVRVTGIDYDTDLKANIVEGGPGYRYMVLVLSGKPDVQYDTVVTIQTLSDNYVEKVRDLTSYEVKEVKNTSAEDTDDEGEIKLEHKEEMSAQITQSSSNVYKYAQNEDDRSQSQDYISDDDGSDVNEDNNDNDQSDSENNDAVDEEINTKLVSTSKEQSYDGDDDENDNDRSDNYEGNSKVLYSYENRINESDNSDELNSDVSNPNSNLNYDAVMKILMGYSRLDMFRPRLYGDVMVYPQIVFPSDKSIVDHSEDEREDEHVTNVQREDLSNNVNAYVSSVE